MQRYRFRIFVVLAALFGLVYFSQNIAWFITDWMWFDASGFANVFTTIFLARLAVGTVIGAAAAAVVFGNGAIAIRSTREYGVNLPGQLAGSPLEESLKKLNLTIPLGAISLLLGGLMGFAGQSLWQDVLMFLHGTEFSAADPIFGYNAAFYVFRLPIFLSVVGLVSAMLFLSGIISTALYFVRGAVGVSLREIDGRFVPQRFHAHTPARRHLGVLVAGWLLMQAAAAVLARYTLMYDQTGLFAGPGYADQFGTLPALWLKAAGLALGAVLVGIGISRAKVRWLIIGGVISGAGWVIAAAVPNLIQQISVVPNELTREAPRIQYHVKGTRDAFLLGAIAERNLDGNTTLTRKDIAENQGTIQNIRLWDHGPLLDTFSEVQEIRTYYGFTSVDNDRYMIDGQIRQIMLSPRELITSNLPPSARTWVNETMKYTHGYGMALGPVNEKNQQGLPLLFVKDLPPKIKYPDSLSIDQPAIYFGETMESHVFVATENAEFDYPNQEQDALTHYNGAGGISVTSYITRSLLALRLGSAKILLTGDFNENSKVLLYRNIRDRVERVVPFLRLDRDPYLVIADGRLVWVQDAYTSTDRYPYSRGLAGIGNYMRNSVKITIDAYDGTMTFYRMEGADPIIDAWASAFPGLFTPESEMSVPIREHLRYPSDFFSIQAHLFSTYHMTEPADFYQREDQWEVPTVQARQMEPYYTVMKIPEENTEEFILMLPFVPKDRPNLAAWLVARADGEHYGEIMAYKFPKESMVYGPETIVARINQDDGISEKLSLWNQQGSQAVLGTLMVIPIEESLIYVQPLYLRAETQPIPELKRVIVGYKNQIAMDETLDGALEQIFGTAVPSISKTPNPSINPATTGLDTSSSPLAIQAHTAWNIAREAARAGDWAKYGTETERLGQLLQSLLEEGPTEESASEENTETEP